MKTNITPLQCSLDKISQLQGVSYDWQKDKFPNRGFGSERQIGFVAQDVEEVIPELVKTDSKGYKALSYDKLTAILVEAVKELRTENAALKAQMDEMKALIEERL